MSLALDRGLALLEHLAAHPDGVPLASLASELDMPLSACHRLLAALQARGYVRQVRAQGDYLLTTKLASLGLIRMVIAFDGLDGHTPVLLRIAVLLLGVRVGGRYVDATVGSGGHAEAILEASTPGGVLLGLDRDPHAIQAAGARLARYSDRVRLVQESFGNLARVARMHDFDPADGVLFDLGLSSLQLADEQRGFSFHADAPLDMRFDPAAGPTAADLLNTLPEDELASVLWRYGEEARARAIARAIVRARARQPLRTARELAQIVAAASGYRRGRTHPATRTFQALRIVVNDELEALAAALPQGLGILRPGGRLVVIAFHSLEDRLVKSFLVSEARPCVCPPRSPECVCGRKPRLRLLTLRPVRPTPAEVASNPRSRSALLRAAERLLC